VILVDTTTPQYSGYKLSIYVFGTLQLVLVNMCCYSMPHTPTAHEEATNSGHAMQGLINSLQGFSRRDESGFVFE